MQKENSKNTKQEKSSVPRIVNKKNYHIMLSEFKDILSKPKKKFLFFNIDFSNLKNFTEHNFQPESYLLDYIKEINKIKSQSQNETQIIYTEFLICLESKKTSPGIKFYAYLIPSIKFHKFITKESYLNINPDSLNYFYFNKLTYPFQNVCQIDSISYSSLQDKEKIEINLDKILTHGKPSKKENTKSYYFFPKNVLVPTKDKQSELVKHIQECFNVIKEIKTTTETSCNDNAIMTIDTNDNYIVERIISFDWRLLANQLDKSVIKGEIGKCLLNGKRENLYDYEKLESHQIYLNFLQELIEYTQDIAKFQLSNIFSESLPHFTFNSPNNINCLSEKFLYNWKTFIELYFSGKVSVSFLNSEDEVRKIEFEFKFIKRTENFDEELSSFKNFLISLKKFLSSDNFSHNVFEESNLYKIENLKTFDIMKLIPLDIAEQLELRYIVNISINLKSLREISLDKDVSRKFTYEELFFNMNNEKEILFDYNLETELYKLVTEIGKIVNIKINGGSSKNIFHFDNKEFFQDFLIMTKCNEEKIKEVFENCIINLKLKEDNRQLSFSFNSEDKTKLTSFLNTFAENEKNYKYKFMETFYKFKKENVIEEEFGLSNFFKSMIDNSQLEKTQLTIVASNLLFKFCLIFLENFSGKNGINYDDFLQYYSNSRLNILDLNYLSELLGQRLIYELNQIKSNLSLGDGDLKIYPEYVTHKNFLIFLRFIRNLNGIDKSINDARIIFFDENLSNYRNKILITQIRRKDNEIYLLDKAGVVKIESRREVKFISNTNKIYLSKVKFDSIELVIEKCKEYGDFMVNIFDFLYILAKTPQ